MTQQVKATIGSTLDAKFKECKISSDGDMFTTAKQVQDGGVLHMRLSGVSSIQSSQSALLVDLSDTTLYPHSSTNDAVIDYIKVGVKFTSSVTGTANAVVKIGVVTSINASNSSISYLFQVPFSAAASTPVTFSETYDFTPCSYSAETTKRLSNDTALSESRVNTATSLIAPTGTPTAPAAKDIVIVCDYDNTHDYDVDIVCKYRSV